MEFKPQFLRHINTVCLPGSRSCSLSCSYCYAGYNNFVTAPDQGLTRELIDKSLDFIVDKLKPIYPPLLVIGFGGDPIEAFDLVLYAHEKVNTVPKYKKIKVVMSTTHGQNLTEEHIAFLEKNGGFISFSIDGTPETHNKTRRSRNTNIDSYKKVVSSYERAKDRLFCSVNSTVSPEGNLAEDIIHLYELGFRVITMLPIRPAETKSYELNDAFTKDLQKQYSGLIEKLKTLDERTLSGILTSITSDDYFNKLLNRIVLGRNFHRKCGAGFNFVYVNSGGEITACSSFRTYQGDQFTLGHVDTGIDVEKIKPFFSFSTHKQEPCKSCEVEKICSGFCFFNSYQTTGILDKPNVEECKLAKHVIHELEDFHEFLKTHRKEALNNYIRHSQKMEEMDAKWFTETLANA